MDARPLLVLIWAILCALCSYMRFWCLSDDVRFVLCAIIFALGTVVLFIN